MRARSTAGGLAALLVTVSLAACGGDSEPEKTPRIPAGVAERLANLSDETAADLEAGDDCAAQEAADELEREALEAEQEIPAELRSEVREGVEKLTADIECTPVTVVETVPEETTTEEEPCPPGQENKEEGKDEHGQGGPGNSDHGSEDNPSGEEKGKKEGEKQRKDDHHCEDAEHGGEGEG